MGTTRNTLNRWATKSFIATRRYGKCRAGHSVSMEPHKQARKRKRLPKNKTGLFAICVTTDRIIPTLYSSERKSPTQLPRPDLALDAALKKIDYSTFQLTTEQNQSRSEGPNSSREGVALGCFASLTENSPCGR